MTYRTRRGAILTGAAFLATPFLARAQDLSDRDPSIYGAEPQPEFANRNVSAFSAVDWRDHFDTLGIASIVADTRSRALHYWNADGSDYRVYPTSVPLTEELTRRGYSEIVRKSPDPSWTPTANMRERDPTLPQRIEGGHPRNPLGTHAMYLDWPAYLIHGTHDTRKIGRRSSSGCIGLYNEKIAELYAITPIGAQVRLI